MLPSQYTINDHFFHYYTNVLTLSVVFKTQTLIETLDVTPMGENCIMRTVMSTVTYSRALYRALWEGANDGSNHSFAEVAR